MIGTSCYRRAQYAICALSLIGVCALGRFALRFTADQRCGARLEAAVKQRQFPRFDRRPLTPAQEKVLAKWRRAWALPHRTTVHPRNNSDGVQSQLSPRNEQAPGSVEREQIDQIVDAQEGVSTAKATVQAEYFLSESYKTSPDGLRQNYLRLPMLPVVTTAPGARWLTVGDFYYGLDAHSLLMRGAGSVLATDIADSQLRWGAKVGLIHEYRALNADDMDLPDDAVDFTLCKEAFHHFPRPMRSLYEMMRVSTRGVLLIEPNELAQTSSPLDASTEWSADGVIPVTENWEQGVNGSSEIYQYKLSIREATKAAWQSNYGMVASTGYHDAHPAKPYYGIYPYWHYLCWKNRPDSRPINHVLVAIWLFRYEPPPATLTALEQAGFVISRRPKMADIMP